MADKYRFEGRLPDFKKPKLLSHTFSLPIILEAQAILLIIKGSDFKQCQSSNSCCSDVKKSGAFLK